jgi:hypothetical protein
MYYYIFDMTVAAEHGLNTKTVETQKSLIIEMEKYGNIGLSSVEWNNKIEAVGYMSQLELEVQLREYRSLNALSQFVKANIEKDVDGFVQALLDNLRFGLNNEELQEFLGVLPPNSQELAENIHTLYHRIPEVFHATTALEALLRMDIVATDNTHVYTKREFKLLSDLDLGSVNEEEESMISDLLSGKNPQQIILQMYKNSQEAAD